MAFEPLNILILLSLGIFCGAMSALIGGSSILAFPVLLWFGLTPIEAAIVLLVSLMPSSFAAAYYDREKLPPLDRSLIKLIVVSNLFTIIGAAMLMATPLATFKLLVPLLLALATLLFAYAERVGAFVERLFATHQKAHSARWQTSTYGMIPVAIYTGYFGAAVGVLLLAVLSIGARGDYRIANATKNLMVGLNNSVATLVYTIAGAVVWPVVALMICGTMIGSWLGTLLAKIAPRPVIRAVVILTSIYLTLYFAYQFWIVPFNARPAPG